MEDVVIVAAARTAVGKFGGSLAKIAGAGPRRARHQGAARSAPASRPSTINEVILGQVLTAGVGQNPARQAVIKAGLPNGVPAFVVNKVCGSGLKATHLAAQAIKCGDAEIIIAGGQENMSAVAARAAQLARRLPHGRLQAGRHHDRRRPVGRLQPVPHGHHRRERRQEVRHLARRAGRVRRRLAAEGRGRAEGRQVQGRDRAGRASRPRRARRCSTPTSSSSTGTTAESLAGLRPAFDKDGTVTAGNASGLNDGAAAVMMMSAKQGQAAGPDAAGAHQGLFVGRPRPGHHGHGPGAGVAAVPEEGRLDARRTST